METTRLTDIDELVLTVRDKISRSYILEAINSYRGGAFRSAIISNWIAVTYDIISKLRELSEQGDRNAKSLIEKLDRAIQNEDIKQLQEIENELLKKAYEDFEFLSKSEYGSLDRLKSDRNFCAHPAFIDKETLFQPTPELVRTHIVHSIKYLLRFQPTQGKAAIDKIIQDIKRLSFPNDLDGIKKFLKTKYLDKAKEALVKNLINALITGIIKNDNEFLGIQSKILNVLLVISQIHTDIYEQQIISKFPQIIDNLEDEHLWGAIVLINSDINTWYGLNETSKIRLSTFLGNLKFNDIVGIIEKHHVLVSINIDELKTSANKHLSELSTMIDEKIEEYGRVRSFREAEEKGENIILPYIPYFSFDNLRKILAVIKKNSQILYASGSVKIIVILFDNTVKYISETREAWSQIAKLLRLELDSHSELYIRFKENAITIIDNNSV